ncbi:MAG TPA: hypothetical protein VFP89_03710 [Propionibacteriaceae bacterium]|nr:hypothetical protein [Propionibacteriaceae bacterium]
MPDTARPAEPRTPEQSQPKKIDLSITQIIGGALAAMTAAAVGSRLGAAGTLIGAALASVVAGVASAVYTASLRHGREKVRTVLWAGQGQSATKVVLDSTPAGVGTEAADAPAAPLDVADVVIDAAPQPEPVSVPAAVLEGVRSSRIRWKAVLAGALAVFAVAAVVITGIEFVSGSSLSGEDGTTIGQVSRAETRKSEPTADPTSDASATEETAPSESPTDEPSAAPESADASATASSTDATDGATEAPAAPESPGASTAPDSGTAPGSESTGGSGTGARSDTAVNSDTEAVADQGAAAGGLGAS